MVSKYLSITHLTSLTNGQHCCHYFLCGYNPTMLANMSPISINSLFIYLLFG